MAVCAGQQSGSYMSEHPMPVAQHPCASHAADQHDSGTPDDTHKCSLCASCGNVATGVHWQFAPSLQVATGGVIPFFNTFSQGLFSSGPDKPHAFSPDSRSPFGCMTNEFMCPSRVHCLIREGAVLRVLPKAMTVAVIFAGLLPVM